MFKKYGFKMAVILSILLLSAVFAYTHSGRTDKYGGHYDRINGGYHYHNSGNVRRSSTSTLPSRTTGLKLEDLVAEGSLRYTPTRSEWLALKLNAESVTHHHLVDDYFSINYSCDFQNTIYINVPYISFVNTSAMNRKLMNDSIDRAKQYVMMYAKVYGWDSWVRIEVKKRLLQ